MNAHSLERIYLQAAVRLGEKGLYAVTRNNPRVGCLLVKDGRVIGRGFHQKDGGHHAEVEALRDAEEDPTGSIAYVSLEPCCVQGRTPSCCDALINAGLSKVVIADQDSNPDVNGKGIKTLCEAGIEVSFLPLDEAKALNVGFHMRMQEERPYIRIKSGISADGRIATESGESQWITGAEARRDVQRLRARSGAILSGIGTVISDNPRFSVRDERFPLSQPLRVILDTHSRLPADAALFEEPGEIIVVTGSESHVSKRATQWTHEGNRANLDTVHVKLAREGVNELLVEAGPSLTGSYLESGCWDEFILYVAPKFLGSAARPVATLEIERLNQAIGGRVESVERIGEDLRIVICNEERRSG